MTKFTKDEIIYESSYYDDETEKSIPVVMRLVLSKPFKGFNKLAV